MAKLPKVSNGAKRCEKVRKYPFLNYESPALAAELQARHALTREHPTFSVQRPIFGWSRVLRRNFRLPAAARKLIAE